jgi:hypothetical protein
MLSASKLLIKRYGRCPVMDCLEAATEEHHILYNQDHGGPFTQRLCPEHHAWITRRQSHAARKHRAPLSVRQRWFFWYELIEGRMQRPGITSLDRQWNKR